MALMGWSTRRKRFAIAAAVAAMSATVLAGPNASASHGGGETIAHRGGTYNTPESTIAAFASALHEKVDGIEFDVQFTGDGVPVVMHDPTVNRTTNCSGSVSNFTWDRLRRCDAGSWFDSSFRGERVPSLHEALSFIEKRSSTAVVFVHVKAPNLRAGKRIMGEIHAHKLGHRVTVMASSHEDLKTMKRAGASRLGYVFSNPSGWSSNYPVLVPYNVEVTKSLVSRAVKRGQKVYTVEDQPYSESSARSRGVTGVLVNDIPGSYSYDDGGSKSGGSRSGGSSHSGGGSGGGGGGGGAG